IRITSGIGLDFLDFTAVSIRSLPPKSNEFVTRPAATTPRARDGHPLSFTVIFYGLRPFRCKTPILRNAARIRNRCTPNESAGGAEKSAAGWNACAREPVARNNFSRFAAAGNWVVKIFWIGF